MIRIMAKVVVWLVAGVGLVAFAVPFTGFEAATPWRYTVQATGNVTAGQAALGTESDPTGEFGTMQMDRTIDFGVLGFIAIVFMGGTIMGRVLKKRPRASSFAAKS